ncbi:MAG: hypothetical protein V4492_08205 [Chlamydiota bacterium]
MKSYVYALLGLLSLLGTSCSDKSQEDSVISERYVHKYGYALSKAEWEAKNHPGQVITTLSNGVTITSTYENGMLHGPMTLTYPHSQTVETYYLYNQGNKVKEISYDPIGMPVKEWIQLSPTRYSISMWYNEGCPMLVEEFAGPELLDGQYFSMSNEVESRIEKGAGLRILRDRSGALVSKEIVEQGYTVKKETHYPNGAPETIAYYHLNNLHGEKRSYAQNGEPLAIEEWVGGKLHGMATYFKNGNRYLEVSYLYGQKNGIERHYIDGDMLSQEICWENDKKHGASTFYVDGKAEKQWFYAGESVSKRRFDEYSELDHMFLVNKPYATEEQR